ncbi:MAG: phosphoribosylanthranilate isomerase [Halanaerobiales bacterium]
MTKVKVCGLMNKKDIDLCVVAGVDILGFVVDYPLSVPWNLTVVEAKSLLQIVPPSISTCAVVGGSVRKIITIADNIHPDIIQLHYKETVEEIKVLVQELNERGIKVVKALCIDSEGKCDFEIREPELAAKELNKIGLSAILVDSYTDSRPGGTGVQVDFSTFKTIQKVSSIPVVLAGGLNPENISSVISEIHPDVVDVLTGVENKPNQKDDEKINKFVRMCQI